MATSNGELGPQSELLADRISLLHPDIWKSRREAALLETQKLYESKILNNHLMNSHDLMKYIQRKVENNGEVFAAL